MLHFLHILNSKLFLKTYFGLLLPNELVMSSKNDDFKICHILNTVVINYFQSFSQVDLYVLSVASDLKY